MPAAVLLRTMARVVLAVLVALSILGIGVAPAVVAEPLAAASSLEPGGFAVDSCNSLLCHVGNIIDGICICL